MGLSHAVIISGGLPAGRERRALDIAASLICASGGERPCGKCRDCRKAYSGIHPDIITVSRETDDKGHERREVYVRQIRAVVSDARVLPNEADGKVYIIKDADALNHAAQNAMLKILEEPPGGVSFVLCAQAAEALLPTVRSRCAEITLGGENRDREEGYWSLAREYVRLASGGNPAELLRFCAANEKTGQAGALELVRTCRELTAELMCGRESGTADLRRVIKLAGLLELAEEYLRRNVGVKHVFGLLAADPANWQYSQSRKDRTKS